MNTPNTKEAIVEEAVSYIDHLFNQYKELEEKGHILKGAVSDNVNFEEIKEHIRTILTLHEQAVQERVVEVLEHTKVKPRTYQVPCPDGRVGCLVMHYSTDTRIEPHERAVNDIIDNAITKIKEQI